MNGVYKLMEKVTNGHAVYRNESAKYPSTISYDPSLGWMIKSSGCFSMLFTACKPREIEWLKNIVHPIYFTTFFCLLDNLLSAAVLSFTVLDVGGRGFYHVKKDVAVPPVDGYSVSQYCNGPPPTVLPADKDGTPLKKKEVRRSL